MSVVAVVLLGLGALSSVRDAKRPEDARTPFRARSNDCGPACLYVATRLAGRQESFRDICQKSQLTDDGTSMLHLKFAARAIGFEVEAKKASAKWLLSNPLQENVCFVLYVRPNHFILVRRSEGKRPFVVFDPSFGVLRVDGSTLTSAYEWSGELLVLKS